MATKTTIQDRISTSLAGDPVITASGAREVENTMLDEFYKTETIVDTQATTNVFTADSSSVDYTLNIKKQGGVVYINGSVTNNHGIIQVLMAIANVTNTEYTPSETISIIGQTSSLEAVTVRVSPIQIFIIGAVGINETVRFNGFYYVNG